MTADSAFRPLLTLFHRVGDLKMLPRTGWLFAGIPDPESLADHTCGVALYALFLAEAINENPSPQGLVAPLDVARVTALALIHDLAESVLTDLPKNTSKVLGNDVKHEAEARIMSELLRDLPGGPRYLALWREYVEISSPEARLIKDVDKLEMVRQALHYARRGHRNLDDFWEDHVWHYPLCEDLYQVLLQHNL